MPKQLSHTHWGFPGPSSVELWVFSSCPLFLHRLTACPVTTLLHAPCSDAAVPGGGRLLECVRPRGWVGTFD